MVSFVCDMMPPSLKPVWVPLMLHAQTWNVPSSTTHAKTTKAHSDPLTSSLLVGPKLNMLQETHKPSMEYMDHTTNLPKLSPTNICSTSIGSSMPCPMAACLLEQPWHAAAKHIHTLQMYAVVLASTQCNSWGDVMVTLLRATGPWFACSTGPEQISLAGTAAGLLHMAEVQAGRNGIMKPQTTSKTSSTINRMMWMQPQHGNNPTIPTLQLRCSHTQCATCDAAAAAVT